MNVDVYHQMLTHSNYPSDKVKYLTNGFKYGFALGYKGPKRVQRMAPNLKIRIGSKLKFWNKVMIEIKAKRYAGPFEKIPFKNYIQSPIGLVPKDKGCKTHLIFHLSFPKGGDSVNSAIPEEECRVTYPDFSDAVKMCLSAGNFVISPN